MSTKVWFITGASRGIGKEIAEHALRRGDKVVATARKPRDLDSLQATHPKTCLTTTLDVNRQSDIETATAKAIEAFGRIDVLVNNAGYGLQGMAEEVSMKQVRAQMETNFFGLVALTQEVLPHMRAQKSGYIINVSSIAGLRGMAGLGIYNASKFAVEGFSEALAQEVAHFGIRVSIVEPGPYRTDWSGSSLKRSEKMKQLDSESPYFEVNKKYKRFFDDNSGNQPGDPSQIASVLMAAADEEQPPLHMIFGDIAIQGWESRKKEFSDPQKWAYFPHEQRHL